VKRSYGAVVTQHYDIGYWIMIMMMIMLNSSCCAAILMPTTNKEKAQLVMKSEKYDSTATTAIVLCWRIKDGNVAFPSSSACVSSINCLVGG
jgi:hypothetical protein